MTRITHLLEAVAADDRRAAEALLPLVYDELRMLAALRMAAEAPGHTLNATALVHEAYLRVLGDQLTRRQGHHRMSYMSLMSFKRNLLLLGIQSPAVHDRSSHRLLIENPVSGREFSRWYSNGWSGHSTFGPMLGSFRGRGRDVGFVSPG
jgi:hypothetical protein